MRILHVLDHSIPHATPYASHTMAILAAQRALGWETYAITGPNHGSRAITEEEIDGWRFYRAPAPGGILKGVPGLAVLELMGEIAHRLERLARRVHPRLLHAHSPVVNAIPALRVGRRLGIPVVYEVRPPGEGRSPAASAPELPRRLLRALETWMLKRADGVVTASDASRAEILLRGVAPAKVAVVACCVDVHASHAGSGAGAASDGADLPRAAGYGRLYEHVIGAM